MEPLTIQWFKWHFCTKYFVQKEIIVTTKVDHVKENNVLYLSTSACDLDTYDRVQTSLIINK